MRFNPSDATHMHTILFPATFIVSTSCGLRTIRVQPRLILITVNPWAGRKLTVLIKNCPLSLLWQVVGLREWSELAYCGQDRFGRSRDRKKIMAAVFAMRQTRLRSSKEEISRRDSQEGNLPAWNLFPKLVTEFENKMNLMEILKRDEWYSPTEFLHRPNCI